MTSLDEEEGEGMIKKSSEEEKGLLKLLKEHNIEVSDAQEMLRLILTEKTYTGYNKDERNKNLNNFKDLLYKFYGKQRVCSVLEDKAFVEAEKVLLPFAEPTYDRTFKMLFGSENKKDILKSFLNNVLGFEGDKEIKEVTINSSELELESNSSVQSSVDVLCTTKKGHKIAIEMQRKNEDYFLAREQEYMSKMISQQVQNGQSEDHHNAMLDTYIIVISKKNIFPDRELKDELKMAKFQSIYDSDKSNKNKEIYYYKEVVPMIKEYNIEIPDNKMHWVFCELSKFAKQHKNDMKKTNYESSYTVKEQWLDFLINGHNKIVLNENIDEIVKRGYETMKTALMESDKRILHWKEIRDKELNEFHQTKKIEDARLEGIEQGKLKGEIKGEIKQFKMLKQMEERGQDVSSFYALLTNSTVLNNKYEENPDQFDQVSLLAEEIMQQDIDFS